MGLAGVEAGGADMPPGIAGMARGPVPLGGVGQASKGFLLTPDDELITNP